MVKNMTKDAIIQMIRDHEAQLDATSPVVSNQDAAVLDSMIQEINEVCGSRFRGYSDMANFLIAGSGDIVAKWIFHVQSHMIRASLLFHLVGDRQNGMKPVRNCADLIWRLYSEYRASSEYFDRRIQMEYDAAFVALRSKALSAYLVHVADNPLEFCWLPRTMKMVASWKPTGFSEVLRKALEQPEAMNMYLRAQSADVKLRDSGDSLERECERWKETASFTAVIGLKHYPSEQNLALLKSFAQYRETEMLEKLAQCQTRTEKYDVEYDYKYGLKVIAKSITHISQALSIHEGNETER